MSYGTEAERVQEIEQNYEVKPIDIAADLLREALKDWVNQKALERDQFALAFKARVERFLAEKCKSA